MQISTRDYILHGLYDERSAEYFADDSEQRTKKLAKLEVIIKEFKAATTSVLDVMPTRLIPHDGNGKIFTTEEWLQPNMRGMAFIPSDGCGNWATVDGFSYDYMDIFDHKPAWATHVVWCNN